jgi:hypothetical protein
LDQDARRDEILTAHKIQSATHHSRAQKRAVPNPVTAGPREISPDTNAAQIPFANVQSLLQLSQLIQTLEESIREKQIGREPKPSIPTGKGTSGASLEKFLEGEKASDRAVPDFSHRKNNRSKRRS